MWRQLTIADKGRCVKWTKLRDKRFAGVTDFVGWNPDGINNFYWSTQNIVDGFVEVDDDTLSTLSPEPGVEVKVGQRWRSKKLGTTFRITEVFDPPNPGGYICYVEWEDSIKSTGAWHPDIYNHCTLLPDEPTQEPTWHQFSKELEPLLVKGRKVRWKDSLEHCLVQKRGESYWQTQDGRSPVIGCTNHGDAAYAHWFILATQAEIDGCRKGQGTGFELPSTEGVRRHTENKAVASPAPAAPTCSTCGRSDNEYCSNSFHLPKPERGPGIGGKSLEDLQKLALKQSQPVIEQEQRMTLDDMARFLRGPMSSGGRAG